MVDLNTIFHDYISDKPKDNSNIILLTEQQNENNKPTKQPLKFSENIKEYCVLKPEKMCAKWFTKTVSMCDYLVLYRKSGSICAVVIEMKSKKYTIKQVAKQLDNGKKLLNCLCCFLDSCNIKEVKYLLLYQHNGIKSKSPIKSTTKIKMIQYRPLDNPINIPILK